MNPRDRENAELVQEIPGRTGFSAAVAQQRLLVRMGIGTCKSQAFTRDSPFTWDSFRNGSEA